MTRQSADGTERVEMLPSPLMEGARWQPIIGEEALRVLDRVTDLDDAGRIKVSHEGVAVLAKCMPPDQPNSRTTGLVLGQVQSGKTLSFTTVAALARDNGYRMVIVITGTTVPLLKQSAGRLRKDLGLESSNRVWKHISVQPNTVINRAALDDALEEWRDSNVKSNERQTVLITVMKQHQNLQKLIDTLASLRLDDVPTLLIDDEGDQASLNNKVRTNEESTTYQRLRALRDCLPRHTFLQYTATPQALLLISIINLLSPSFAELLTLGDDYTGGKEFFLEHHELVREIPPNEVPTKQVPLTEPPESLFHAMRLFFLGVANGMSTFAGGNRSMMIHPSVTRAEHAQFHHWVLTTKEEWQDTLKRAANDADRIDLINDFRPAYDDLKQTVPTLPPFDELADKLLLAVRRTQVEKVNAAAGSTPHIDWNDSYAFILVGGTAMDRGYTVRGLTVTYMPRGLGDGNADNVQQRGRFFGYKKGYLDHCRVFLEGDVLRAFRSYVEHEEDVRARLARHKETGRPLSEWPRAFLLDIAMKPTRQHVIDIPYQRRKFGDDWYWPKAPHDSPDAISANRALIAEARGWLTLIPDSGSAVRTDFQRHLFAERVPLRDLYERLLAPFKLSRFDDSQDYVSLQLILKIVLEGQRDALATVYLMSGGKSRERTVDADSEIPFLFQGAAPVQPPSKRGSVYPGDSALHDASNITVQIHNITVLRAGAPPIQDVPAIALWLPPALGRHVVVQPQGGHSTWQI
jgi:hypothetical protein